MAVRAQTSIEFLLILSAVVLVVLAGVMSLSEIMKMQQGAYSAAQSGVGNASSSLLTYLSNETFGTGFYPVSGGFGNYTDASLVSLELTKNEPYLVNQPAVIQLTAWNNYADPMKVPRLLIWIVNSSGNQTPLSPSEEDNVTIIASHTLTATFIPQNAGVYNVSAVAQDDNGNTLINPNTSQPVLFQTNFTVLAISPPSSGIVKTFNIDKDVVAKKDTVYSEIFSLPQDAVIYFAVLEITDPHKYEDKTSGAQASYHYSQIDYWDCSSQGGGNGGFCNSNGVYSSNLFSQQGTVEIPSNSFVIDASYVTKNVIGIASVFVNGMSPPIGPSSIVHGVNTIALSIAPSYSPAPQNPLTNYASHIASGDVLLTIKYYAPAAETADVGEVTGIMVNGNSVSAGTVTDISQYMKGGDNTLSFGLIEGTFHYKLVVTYA
ncbi:hypothetical protein H0N99_02365 [Candidatus Micrarchaeota archaeon]|nr:hypothetical protein [Candidatus Micrarchaeota archaeon]